MSGNSKKKSAASKSRRARSRDKKSNEKRSAAGPVAAARGSERSTRYNGPERRKSSIKYNGPERRSIRNASDMRKTQLQRSVSISDSRRRRRRKPSIIRNIKAGIKRFFSYLGRMFSRFFSRFTGKNAVKIPAGIIAGAAAVILIGITIFFFTHRNALSIEVDDFFIGTIERNRHITAEHLQETAIAKITAEVGTRVQVAETVTITPVNAGRRDLITVDFAIDSISRHFTYMLEAAIITIDGREIATLRNVADAQDVLDRIISTHVGTDANIVDSGFVEDVAIVSRFVDSEEIIRSDLAFSRLTTTTMTESLYQVQHGDTIWDISRNHGITQEQFATMNPGVTPETLRAGQTVVLMLPTPILSIRTVEEFTYTELAPHRTETVTNPTQNRGWTRVQQQGRDGQREVTAHIVRVNGFERERIIVDTVITVPPVDEIIEVGTR